MTDADIDRIATEYEVPLWCVAAAVELGYIGDGVIGHVAGIIAKHEVMAKAGAVEWQDEPAGSAE